MKPSTLVALSLLVLSPACRAEAPSTPPQGATVATAVPVAAPLADVAAGLATGRFEVVDLTQPLGPDTPIINLPKPFANTPGFKAHVISNYDDKGPAWYWNWLEVGEHVGTHFDAPCHWVTGKDKPCVDALPAEDFVGPAAVIDVSAQVASNVDFVATKETVLEWEKANGRLPDHSWVILRTGWASHANDQKSFLNVGDDGRPHYPGWGKDSAEFLSKERNILGVGTEAVGTDAAVGAGADPPFPNHSIMHGSGRYGLTQLTNVDRLPATGALLVATPLKIQRGSGSPVRVIAIVPKP
ncbi:MAG: cyclase family protein [Vicinamibacterales bacterium]